jgi:hypothetical protein
MRRLAAHRTCMDTQLYKVLQTNCEPCPPILCTSGDLVAVCNFG